MGNRLYLYSRILMDKKRKIFVIDDEPDLCDILVYNLQNVGYEASAFHSAKEALQHGMDNVSLILLDVMMPGMSGFEMSRRLKQDSQTAGIPIIFLTAKDTENDKLRGFDLGADDYITKPFSVREVLARVKAVLNRSHAVYEKESDTLVFDSLVINQEQKSASIDGEPVTLTKTELELLSLLLYHRGHVFSRQQLIEQVWPKNVIVTDRTVDVNMARLRKKIGRYAANIVSRQGYGYLFEV